MDIRNIKYAEMFLKEVELGDLDTLPEGKKEIERFKVEKHIALYNLKSIIDLAEGITRAIK